MGDPMDIDSDMSSEIFDVNVESSASADLIRDRYQKENHLLKHLPYYNELQIETEEYLNKIILNLAKCIICHDFQLGGIIYIKSLRTYIFMYGRKFTKDQHIKLVNLFVELLTTKECPLNVIPDVAEMLNSLLRKPELLTRDDICIPWRLLYETLDRCVFHRKYTLSFNASAKMENLLKETIRLANVYFEKNTLPEVIAEFTPMLCPTSPKMVYGLEMLKHFMPFLDPEAEEGVNKFLEHLLSYCDGWNNNPTWEWTIFSLFATAAWNMPGSFDWTPYLPMIYARLMKNLELPVHFKNGKPVDSNLKAFEYGSAARWIVSTLGNNPVALKHLCNFLKSLETYYNPSNHGKWTMPLGALLNELVNSFTHRLKKERYMDNKKRWWYRIPDERKLTDEDIEKFVKTTSYIVLDFYLDLTVCGMVLKNLATIRPDLIIPAVMEKYEGIVETLTEPRKYMTALRWVTVCMLPMVSSRKEVEGYDGRKLVIPFAMSLLPAVDPNDMYKTLTALGCLHGLFNLLPLVDCSSLADSIEDEEEREICISTACMEDFVVQFLDRILSLVESRSVENTRMADNRTISEGANVEDVSLEKFLWAVFHRISTQCSTQICKTTVKKLVSFALGSTLETAVSGKLFASILQAFVVARPEIILPRLLPALCSSIRSHITDEILDDEDLDKTLLFQLLLLSYIMESSGPELLKFKTEIESTLVSVLRLNGKKAYGFASQTLSRLLHSLVYTYPTDSRISEADYDDPKYLAIKDWGVSIEPKTIQIKWHVPNQEELGWAKEIFFKVFTEYSSKLQPATTLTEGNDEFNKRLLKNLRVMLAAYDGISTLLSFWDDVPVETTETVCDLTPDHYNFGIHKPAVFVPGTEKPVTKRYFEIYCEVFDYLQKFKADDTDAFIAIMKGYDSLVIPHIESDRRLVAVTKSNNAAVSLQNALDPKKKYTRGGIVVRAYDIHLKRVRCASATTWTKSHVEVMHRLFQLCINHYARVRINAQNRFFRILDSFDGLICRTVSHFFEEHLKEGVHHDEYKGTLFTMLGRGVSPLLQNSWAGIQKLWLALVHSPFSEKNSIIKIMDKIKNTVTQNFIYYPLQLKIPTNSKIHELAKALLSKSQIESFQDLQLVTAPENIVIFMDLLNGLTEAGVDGNVHWRRQVMCANMLSVLIIDEKDVPMTKRMIEVFFEGLISHSIDIRKMALTTVSWLLVLFKREYPTVEVNPKNGIVLSEGESLHSVLQYKSKPENGNNVKVNSKWNVPEVDNGHAPELHIHKIHYGFAGLPNKMKIKFPTKNYSDMSSGQSRGQHIVLETTQKYFSDEDFVQKLLVIWCLEEKGKTKSNKRASICKSIARNNGPEALKILLKLVKPLGVDKDQWKQRCAADVLCGIIFGMKLWDDKTTEEFWAELKPVFSDSLDSVTQETMKFWSTALSYPTIPYCNNLRCYPGSVGEMLQAIIGQMAINDSSVSGRRSRNVLNRDPNKMRFFIEFLRERFMKSLETAQTTSVDAFKEMTFFEQAIGNIQWRGGDVFFETLNLVKKHFFDQPIPYMNVRVQLGRLLGDVFEWDAESPVPVGCDFCPKYEPFVSFLFENLKTLEEEAAKYRANDKDCEANAEVRKLLLKFKTILEWILSVCWDNESTVPSSFFRFIPLLCHFESYDPDPEIAQSASIALSGLARTLINPKYMDVLMNYLNEAANSSSWRTRLCVLEFLRVFALNNSSVFASSEKWSGDVVNLVMKLLSDRQLEVRDLASKIICGFLHCLLVQEPMELLKQFQKTATEFKKNRQKWRQGKRGALSLEEIDKAHSAILGLSAFVDTHPYHVPAYLPDILITLTTHVNDPQPISTTIKKCLSNFRRTHHDNWSVHKTKFSEDQLCILTEIFVSPCYYA